MADGSGVSISQLGVRVDATSVDSFISKRPAFVGAGAAMEAAVDKLGSTSKRASSALSDYAQEVAAATKVENDSAISALKAAKAHEALVAETQKASMSFADIQKAYPQAVGGVGRYTDAQKKLGSQMRLTTAESLNFSRQLSDIGVTAAMGMNPIMILIQQGPQIADIFQTAAARGVSFKSALAGMAAEAGAIAAVVGPIVLLGGALAAVAVAFTQGDAEGAKLANTLALVGTNAGVTAVEVETMARKIAGEGNTSIAKARDGLIDLIRTGKLTGETVNILGADVVKFARFTGQSTQEAAGYFGKMGDDAAKFAADFQKSYGGISAAQVEYIRLLQDQGRTTEAQLAAAMAVHKRLGTVGVENLGYLEKAWMGVGNAISNAWSWLKMWGNEGAQTANKIANVQKEITSNNAKIANTGTGQGNPALNDERSRLEARGKVLQSTLDALKKTEAEAKKSAEREAEANRVQVAGTVAAQQHADVWSQIGRNVSRATEEVEKYRRGQEAIRKANPNSAELDSPAERARIEADIRKRYGPSTSGSGVSRQTRMENAGDNAVNEAAKAEVAARRALTKNIEALGKIRLEEIDADLKAKVDRLAGDAENKRITASTQKQATLHYEEEARLKRRGVILDQDAQLFERELSRRSSVQTYVDRATQTQIDMAQTLEERQALERRALSERQASAADELERRILIQAATDDTAVAYGVVLRNAQIEAQTAERIALDRQQLQALVQRDLARRQAAVQNEVDLLQSQQGLATSSYAAGRLEVQIRQRQYQLEKDRLDKITLANGFSADEVQDARSRAVVVRKIYENELRQLELSNGLSQAIASAAEAFSGMAQSIARGDVGGSISGLSSTLGEVAGMFKDPNSGLGKLFGQAGAALAPIGATISAAQSVLGIFGQASAEKAQRKLDALNKGVEDLRADNKASSGSIAGALARANSNWNTDLEYSSAMVTSLRSIDNQIGALANTLARSITTSGMLNSAGLGLGTTGSATGGLFGAVGALLFGNSKTKTELLDQGVAFNPTTFGALSAGGLTGSTYADLVTTKTKSLLGVNYSTKVTNSTVNGALGGDLLSQITAVIQALGKGVIDAASVFGAEAAKSAEAALGSAVVDLGKLSLKDLKSDEIADVLNATLDKVADQLAAAGVPGLEKLAGVGEGAFETLTRLAREYQVVDVALASLGKTFGQVGLASIAARDDLVQLFGGLDAFTSQTSFFAENFLTDAERLAPIMKAVNDNLKAYGLSAESSRDQFKGLVLAQDLTTEAGRAAYAALLAVAPAFDKVASAAEDSTAKALEAQARAYDEAAKSSAAYYEKLTSDAEDAAARQAEAAAVVGGAIDRVIGKFLDLSKSLNDYANSLSGAGLTGAESQSYTRASIENALKRGDYTNIEEMLKAFVAGAQDQSSTTAEYQAAIAWARSVALQASAGAMGKADKLGASWTSSLPKYANGGSMAVGGYPGVDQNLLSINGEPRAWVSQNETMTVTPVGRPASNDSGNAQLLAKIQALIEEVQALRSANENTANNTGEQVILMQGMANGSIVLSVEGA